MNSNNQHIHQIKVNNISNWGLFGVQKVMARCQTALKHDSTFSRECWQSFCVLKMRIIANMLESTAVLVLLLLSLSRAFSDSPDQIIMLRFTCNACCYVVMPNGGISVHILVSKCLSHASHIIDLHSFWALL